LMMFPERVSSLEVSGIRKLFESAPQGAINLGLGEPDIQPPQEMIRAFESSLESGQNKYGPSAGVKELREAIAASLRRYRKDVSYENIIVTAGATEGMMIASETIIGEGDEALVPNPGFIIYGPDIRLAGGKAIEYSLKEENGFLPDVEEIKSLITPRTKAIVVNSPSNPMGTVFPKEIVKAIGEVATDHGLYILSDEVYHGFVYEGEHWSFARFHDDTIIVNSFSKSLAATGWRIGYVATSKEIVKQLSKVQYYTLACPPTPTQFAVLEGLKVQDEFMARMVGEFRERRALATKKLQGIPSFSTPHADGAFYLFPKYSQEVSSEKFALKILEAGVICAAGSSFGSLGEGHLRFSYANTLDNLAKGFDIVRDVASSM
jgi:aspartate aminotransferase